MSQRGDEAGYGTFVRFGGPKGSRLGGELVSRAALQLHVYAILASIEAGRPGRITDDYLDRVTVDTSLAAIELCTAGLWARVEDGYTVLESETFRVALEVHRQLEELSERCRINGGHRPDPDNPALCCRCAVRLT